MLVEMAERALTAALADRSALNIALSVTSLLHFGTPPGELAEAVEELLHLQTAEGWPPEGFCIDPSQHGRPYVAGSAALTTAVCLEALWGYYRATTGAGEVEEASKVSAGTSGQAKESWDEVEGLVKGLPGLIGADALAWCRRLRQQDRDGQIVQLPWLMADVVKGGREVPAKLLRQLAVANAVGWMAYTIQDDVIDGDLPVSAIPGVGVLMRLVRQRFALVLPRDVGFQRLADEVLIGMDEVSRWELERCRLRTPGRLPRHLPDFGDYRRLANRSAGHILGAAGVLAAAGWPVDGQENQQLQQAWRHILIARQLNDDAHDWEEDWRRGRINAVTVLVVGDVRATAKGTIRVRPDLDDLRLQFWQQTIDTVAALIHEHCRLARELLQHNPALASTAALAQLLEPLEQAANRALAGRGQAQMFVDRFKGQS